MMDRHSIGEITIDEIKKHLGVLGDKLQIPKNNKSLMVLLEEKTVWNESLRETKLNLSANDESPNTGKNILHKETATSHDKLITVPPLNLQST
jgi:hypothetical protein